MSKFDNSWLPVALYIMVLAVISFVAVLTVANKNKDTADINE